MGYHDCPSLIGTLFFRKSLTGLTFETAFGKGWRTGLHPDDRDRVTTEWQQSVQANRPFLLEYRFQHPNGAVKWVYGQSVAERDDNGQVVGYVGAITDISDRKQIEAERLRSEKLRLELKLLEQLFDTALAGYWDWDIPNHKEYLSPGFKRMFGYAEHELPNSPESWQNLIFPEDLQQVLQCFDASIHKLDQ